MRNPQILLGLRVPVGEGQSQQENESKFKKTDREEALFHLASLAWKKKRITALQKDCQAALLPDRIFLPPELAGWQSNPN